MNNEFGLPNQLKTTLSMKKYQLESNVDIS
jgi:hypothetical protein